MSKFDLQSDAEIPKESQGPVLDSTNDNIPKCIGCGQLLMPFPGIGMFCSNLGCNLFDDQRSKMVARVIRR